MIELAMRPVEFELLACYVALLAGCVVLPYLLGMRPRRPSDWRYIAATVTFLRWLLAGFVFLRS